MFGDDYLNDTIKSLQDPLRQARQYMEDISLSRQAERLTRETLDVKAALDRQLTRPMDEAYRALAHPRNVMDRYRDPLRDAVPSLSDLAGCRAADAAAACGYGVAALSRASMPASIAELTGYSAAQEWMQDPAATLSAEALRQTRLEMNLDVVQAARLPQDSLGYMETYFAEMRNVASALRPLEDLSASLYKQFGDTLTTRALHQELKFRPWADAAPDHQRAFQTFLDLASKAMGYPIFDDEEAEAEDTEPNDEIAALCDVEGDLPQVNVYGLALRFTMSWYELQVKLRRLASRVDHTAFRTTTTWDRMILAIGSAHPTYARDLVQIAHPLLQRLAWREAAPAGSATNQTVEMLSMEDAEQFDELVQAMLAVLKRIEASMSE